MKIIPYSDLHLEFGANFLPMQDSDVDVMILAGDICVLKDYAPPQTGTQAPLPLVVRVCSALANMI